MNRAVLFMAALLAATSVHAAEPKIGRTALTLPDSTAVTDKFTPDTAKIMLHVELLNVPVGSKVGAEWIAADVKGVAADFKIDAAEVTVTQEGEEATFSVSKPDSGWPVGSYRIDLSIDDAPMESVDFSVAE